MNIGIDIDFIFYYCENSHLIVRKNHSADYFLWILRSSNWLLIHSYGVILQFVLWFRNPDLYLHATDLKIIIFFFTQAKQQKNFFFPWKYYSP